MRRRRNWDPVALGVDPGSPAGRHKGREVLLDIFAEHRRIEEATVCAKLRHPLRHRPAHHVSRRQVTRPIRPAQVLTVTVTQPGAGASQGLGGERPRVAAKVHPRWVELYELEVSHLGTGSQGRRQTVATARPRARRASPKLAVAAGGEYHRAGVQLPQHACPGVPDDSADHPGLVGGGKQVDQEQPIGDGHATSTGGLHQCPSYLSTGSVAPSVGHACDPMAALPAKGSLVEMDAEPGERRNSLRRTACHHVGHLGIAEPRGRQDGVQCVGRCAVALRYRRSNAALGEQRAAPTSALLGDHGDATTPRQSDRSGQASYPRTDDQDVELVVTAAAVHLTRPRRGSRSRSSVARLGGRVRRCARRPVFRRHPRAGN
jgi:hypothetical protein